MYLYYTIYIIYTNIDVFTIYIYNSIDIIIL